MSTVIFDAPQSIGDDLIDAPFDGEMGYSRPADETNPDLDETKAAVPETPAAEATPAEAETDRPPEPATEQEPARSEANDLLDQIWNTERECREKEGRVDYLKEELKEAKSSLETAVLRLRELCSRHESATGQKPPLEKKSEPEPSPATDVEAAVETSNADWRSTALAELLQEPIKGLGKKKKEALIEMCPTLGDLEDLRARVGRDAAEFHELLPKHIGLDIASAIEGRMLTWIAKHPQRDPAPIATDKEAILKRAAELNDKTDGSLDAKHIDGRQFYESGWEAFGKTWPLEDCPYAPGTEQDDWIRGWLAHELMERYSKASGDTQEKPVTLDDL